jgi:integrase
MIRLGWCRNVLNRHLKRVQRVFKWAASRQLVPGSVYADLATVEGLRKGHPGIRETQKVRPVPDAQVEAVLSLLSPQVRAMIELQRLTGARSTEICSLRTGDIDTGGKVWIYRPQKHKTAHHDQVREILLGPRAREILEPHLKPDLQAFVFSPAEAAEWHREQRRAKRQTPLTPSQRARSERARQSPQPRRRQPGSRYTKDSYGEAIERACDIAFPPPAELARLKVKTPRGKKQTRLETRKEWRARLGEKKWAELLAWRKAHRWHPHQLRHSFATRIRKEFGREVVGTMLGDKSPRMIDTYAERDAETARKVAAQVG